MAGLVGFIMNLARMQRMAAVRIMGALHNMATDVLDAYANLLPMALQINKFSQRAVVRYAALSKTHPVYKVIWRSKRYVKRYRMPMHELLEVFQVSPGQVETIEIV